jgi:methylmalonyl-CoA mutase N-terminal domain/subunit
LNAKYFPEGIVMATPANAKGQYVTSPVGTLRKRAALATLTDAARSGENGSAAVMDAARVCSLQQITEAFFEVCGQYRRNV